MDKRKKIVIVSPSGAVESRYIDGAEQLLESWGYQVSIGKSARKVYGRFAGTDQERVADLQLAFDDEDVFAILCSRGGYGLAPIIDKLDFTLFAQHPKWLIGFSDITVLHAVLSNFGIPSLHAGMTKHLTESKSDALPVVRLREILYGKYPTYKIPAHPLNRRGTSSGRLIGGNLSVLMGLRGSRFDLNYQHAILFIEEISEEPYHIDRMMHNLRLSGIVSQLSGLVVGHLTDCKEDPQMKKSMRQSILDATAGYDFPVCFDFPAGHEEDNYPLILGREVVLAVGTDEVVLDFS